MSLQETEQLWGGETTKAVDNFPISGETVPVSVIRWLGQIKGAAARVNAVLIRTGARPELERHDGQSWHLHFHAADNSLPNGWAAGCATGLAVVLGGSGADRLGVCTAPGCDRVFVDTSRNGTRRYCSTSCQNRVKTAAFRARLT